MNRCATAAHLQLLAAEHLDLLALLQVTGQDGAGDDVVLQDLLRGGRNQKEKVALATGNAVQTRYTCKANG